MNIDLIRERLIAQEIALMSKVYLLPHQKIIHHNQKGTTD